MKNIILGLLLLTSFFLVSGCVSSESNTMKNTTCSGGKCAKSKGATKCAKSKASSKCASGKCGSSK